MEKLKMESVDLTQKNIEKIELLFPNVITEIKDENGKLKKGINFELLKQELSGDVIDGEECYDFTWVGKKAAIVEGNTQIRKTLRPCIEESKDWENTENLYIEGDNLEALKLLQESYLGAIKMIYIDPPYNTGNDFIYRDNFSVSKEEYIDQIGLYDEEENRLFKNIESNGRFHSDWCSMIYPRLKLAHNLLSEDGVVFISIDDNELYNLKKICDEVFGEQGFLGCFVVNTTPNARDYGHIGKMHEYVIFYGKNAQLTETYLLPDEEKSFKYEDEKGGYNIHPLYNSNVAFTNKNRPNLYYPFYLNPKRKIEQDFYEISLKKTEGAIEIYPPISVKGDAQFVWRWGKEKSEANINKEIIGYKINDGEYRVVQKMRTSEKLIRSLLLDKGVTSRKGTAEVEQIFGKKVFSFPKPIQLLSYFCRIALNSHDIVLDIFSGSSTTAQAVMRLNVEDGDRRKFIMVQLPESIDEESEAFKSGYKNICEIGKERIRRAGEKIKDENPDKNLDIGFRVLKVDSTNMKDVYYAANEYSQSLLSALESNIKEDRSDLDLLYGVLLDWGLPLSLNHKIENIDGVSIHTVDEGSLVACFAEQISESVVREIAKRQPLRVVFRDSSFTNSPDKINVEEIFKLLAPNTTVKVI